MRRRETENLTGASGAAGLSSPLFSGARTWWIGLLFIGLLAFGLRAVAGFDSLESPLRFGLTQMADVEYYDQHASEILAGDWLGQQVFYLAPLYPYALALVYLLAGGVSGLEAVPGVIVFQSLLGAGSSLLVASLARRFGGIAAGLLAGAAAAVYEPFVYQETILMPTGLILFTHLLALRAYVLARDRQRAALWPLAGVTLACAAIAHGGGLGMAGLLTVWTALFAVPGSRRRSLAAAGLLLIGLSVPILCVTARNWVVGQDLVLITSNAGKNFYIGHHPTADGTFAAHRFSVWGTGLGTYLERIPRNPAMPTPSEISSDLTSQAIGFIRDDPWRTVRLTARKLNLLFNWHETAINDNQYFARRYSPVLSLPLLSFAWIGPLGLVGMALGLRRLRELGPLYAAAASQVIVFTVMFVLGRYRAFLAALLMVFGALLLVWAVRRISERRFKPVIAAVVALVPAIVWVNHTVPGYEIDRGFGQQHLNVAREHLEGGKLALAAEHARECLRHSFAPWRDLRIRKARVLLLRGRIALERDRPQHARRLLTRALRRARSEDTFRDEVQELIEEIETLRASLPPRQRGAGAAADVARPASGL